VDERVQRHITTCSICPDTLDEMRNVDQFLTHLRDELDDRIDTMAPTGVPDPIKGLTFRRELGRGCQGVVYEAVQEEAHRVVAVKVLQQSALTSAGRLAPFRREIRLAASLQHPNIVTLHGVVDLPPGRVAYVMQRIDGIPLNEWCEQLQQIGPTKRRRRTLCLTVMTRLVRAVAYAHATGVIHRDLKPSNVLVDTEQEPHILDFGIACAMGEPASDLGDADTDLPGWATRTNEFIGSPHYAAPEQFIPGAPVDERTDVYALGVMLREAVKKSGMSDDAVSRSYDRPESKRIILCSTAVNPDDRYSSAESFADDLERLMAHQPITARPTSLSYVIRKFVQRHPVVLAIGLGLATLAGTLTIFAYHKSSLLTQRTIDLDRAAGRAAIDRAASLIESGTYVAAEDLLWDALLTGSSGSGDDLNGLVAAGPARSMTSPALSTHSMASTRRPSRCPPARRDSPSAPGTPFFSWIVNMTRCSGSNPPGFSPSCRSTLIVTRRDSS